MSKMSAFAKKDIITIDLWRAKCGQNEIMWYSDEKTPEGDLVDSTLYSFSFRWPTWKDSVAIEGESMEIVEARVRINPAKMRYTRFEKLLQSWNLTDDEGNESPINQDSIADLNPDISHFVLDRLESILEQR